MLMALLLDKSVIFIGILVVFMFVNNIYYQFFRVNEDTNHIDLMERYLWFKMKRRYYDENL